MYTNGNFESHLAALCFLGTLGLTVMLAVVTLVLFFKRRAWARIHAARNCSHCSGAMQWRWPSSPLPVMTARWRAATRSSIAAWTATSLIRCGTSSGRRPLATSRRMASSTSSRCDRISTSGQLRPGEEMETSHPDPPTLTLIDANGRSYSISDMGQRAWEATHARQHSLSDGLRPGESFETDLGV